MLNIMEMKARWNNCLPLSLLKSKSELPSCVITNTNCTIIIIIIICTNFTIITITTITIINGSTRIMLWREGEWGGCRWFQLDQLTNFLPLLNTPCSISNTSHLTIKMKDRIQYIFLKQFHIFLCWTNEWILTNVLNNQCCQYWYCYQTTKIIYIQVKVI